MERPKHKIRLEASGLKLIRSPKRELRVLASQIRASDQFDKLFPTETAKDILYISLISHTINHINKNDCIIAGDEGLASYKTIAEKALDIEHERTDIVGFCIRSFLSNLKNNKVLDEEQAGEIIDNNGQVNVGAIFAVWKINYPEVVQVLEDNFDENSEYYGAVKASFEYYFNDYDLFVSEGNADYPNGKIIAGDSEEGQNLFNLLRINGGTGLEEGNRVSIMPRDGFIGGCALTLNPANEYSDVLAKKDGDKITTADTISEINNSLEDLDKTLTKAVEITSATGLEVAQAVENIQKSEETLKSDHDTSVDIKGDIMNKTQNKIEQVKTEVVVASEVAEKTIEATIAPVQVDESMAKALQVEMDKKIAELGASEAKQVEIEAKNAELQASLEKTNTLLAQVQEKLDKEIEARNLREAELVAKEEAAVVASRLAALNEVFEVNDGNRALLESEVATLSPEDFEKKVSIYRSIKANKLETPAKESVKTVVEEVIVDTAKSTPSVDVIVATPSKSLGDEYAAAFGDPKSFGIKI